MIIATFMAFVHTDAGDKCISKCYERFHWATAAVHGDLEKRVWYPRAHLSQELSGKSRRASSTITRSVPERVLWKTLKKKAA